MDTYVKYNSNEPLSFYHAITHDCEVDIHLHDSYEIFQALSANIRYFVEGEAYDLNKGDIIITSSREIHRPITIDDSPYDRRFIQFDPSMIPTYSNTDYQPLHIFENRKLGQNNRILVPHHVTSVIDNFFETIHAATISQSPRNLYEGWLALQSFFVELELLFNASNTKQNPPQIIDQRIINIRQYLDKHFTEPFNLDDLSKKNLIDKYHLCHLFKESTGFTLLEYIQSKRIKQAKTLLIGKENISEISRACGYEDYTNFFKTFKKMTKMSPKQYRASLLG